MFFIPINKIEKFYADPKTKYNYKSYNKFLNI